MRSNAHWRAPRRLLLQVRIGVPAPAPLSVRAAARTCASESDALGAVAERNATWSRSTSLRRIAKRTRFFQFVDGVRHVDALARAIVGDRRRESAVANRVQRMCRDR